jgi:hypothetical protein
MQLVVQRFSDLAVLVIRREDSKDWIEVAHRDPGRIGPTADLLQPLLPALRRVVEKDLRQGREFRWIPKVNDLAIRLRIASRLWSRRFTSCGFIPLSWYRSARVA